MFLFWLVQAAAFIIWLAVCVYLGRYAFRHPGSDRPAVLRRPAGYLFFNSLYMVIPFASSAVTIIYRNVWAGLIQFVVYAGLWQLILHRSYRHTFRRYREIYVRELEQKEREINASLRKGDTETVASFTGEFMAAASVSASSSSSPSRPGTARTTKRCRCS